MRSDPRRAIAAWLAVVAAYVALAVGSSSITPLARGPLLDGIVPVNYRWVSPPPELAATNQEPSSGRFDLPLDRNGVGTQVAFTSDSQVTVSIDERSIGPAPGQRSVQLSIEPVDPAGLASPGEDFVFFGNAYELRASYRPSGDRIEGLDRPFTVILTYPATSELHSTSHDMVYSPDGRRWEFLDTIDSPGLQQAEADVPGLGSVAVVAVPTPFTPSAPAGDTGGTPPIAIALLVAAGVVFLIGVGLLVRSRAR